MSVHSVDARRAQCDNSDGRNKPPDFYTLSEFAELTHRKTRSVYDLLALGAGPRVVRVGRRTLIRRTDYERWLEALPECAFQTPKKED